MSFKAIKLLKIPMEQLKSLESVHSFILKSEIFKNKSVKYYDSQVFSPFNNVIHRDLIAVGEFIVSASKQLEELESAENLSTKLEP